MGMFLLFAALFILLDGLIKRLVAKPRATPPRQPGVAPLPPIPLVHPTRAQRRLLERYPELEGYEDEFDGLEDDL